MLSWCRPLSSTVSSLATRTRSNSVCCFGPPSYRLLHHSTASALSSSAPEKPLPITIVACSSRIDLLTDLDTPEHPTTAGWPRFLAENTQETEHLFEEDSLLKWQFMAILREGVNAEEKVIGLANSIPFYWSTPNDNNSLPDLGWDAVMRSGLQLDRSLKNAVYDGPKPNALSAVAVSVDPAYRFKKTGRDIAAELLNTMKTAARDSGFSAFVLPVRPTGKASSEEFIKMDFEEYCAKVRGQDGVISGGLLAFNSCDSGAEPWDPWIRKHIMMGGKIARPALQGTTIKGTKKEWEKWTGVDFGAIATGERLTKYGDGKVSVDIMIPGGLVPVKYFPATDTGIYEEPNLWMRYF
ncbi:hypothetical protein K493DRAFT_314977 [Basidiobolus meristosporus CBS 931.73]|uniref:Uncharacterized protein n=1 Tax=Basidiobolus meristosporus CBS 931.73 TaxID=1314790 RepID=A0A1Y1YBW9_9FUNG|nr:hypothetical protein K493DRAFT_314977 [Basidiobolus meristosporus CBS 931.73]|eukprot:ORX95452.1 hypothetical protein K493DRAFT_314977 [Basidiobolus meristosporus CBS 931.73]